MDKDFHEQFLKANANPEFISSRFSDVVRNLMRAVAATDSSSALSSAAREMGYVADLLQRCDTPISWYGLFSDAIDSIRRQLPDDPYDKRYLDTARDGVKYLVECSATDNAARGRAAKRLSDFISAIKYSSESRRGS